MDFESITWAGIESDYNDRPVLIRFREFPKKFPKSEYPRRINIFWKMYEPDENGLALDDESNRLEIFEDRLIEAVEHDGHSILAGALTGNGQREFIFFTRDVPGFLERLTNMPQEKERYPITIHEYNDPNWDYLESVIEGA